MEGQTMDAIRVAIRVRPLIQRELANSGVIHWKTDDQKRISQNENGKDVPHTTYVFDRVFDGKSETSEVYEQFAEGVVKNAMQGFNGTIFAYGQTSTGKTHTMMGDNEHPGIIPSAVNDVFTYISNTTNREFLLRVSYMELYNEDLTDLLSNPLGIRLKVRNNDKNEVYVENLTETPVSSAEQILQLMESGERHRHFGETNMNERSSRSHTVFRMIIESRQVGPSDGEDENYDGAVTVSHLNLVDLAGSERASQSGAEGARLKESGFINKSLLTLGNVISKLASDGQDRVYIPYRDSKLTRILKNSLGGNAYTSIICTVTPAVIDETHTTLKFASRAKTIENKPHVNEVLDGDTMLRKYKIEIKKLKKQVDQMQSATGMEHLMNEREKMEQLLEEQEKKQIEQEEKIRNLTQWLIVGVDHNLPKKKKPVRRETWCAAFLKKDIERARQSTSPKFRIPHIDDNSSRDEDKFESFQNKSGFHRDMSKIEEECESLEPKRKRRGVQFSSSSPKKR